MVTLFIFGDDLEVSESTFTNALELLFCCEEGNQLLENECTLLLTN